MDSVKNVCCKNDKNPQNKDPSLNNHEEESLAEELHQRRIGGFISHQIQKPLTASGQDHSFCRNMPLIDLRSPLSNIPIYQYTWEINVFFPNVKLFITQICLFLGKQKPTRTHTHTHSRSFKCGFHKNWSSVPPPDFVEGLLNVILPNYFKNCSACSPTQLFYSMESYELKWHLYAVCLFCFWDLFG